MFYIQLVMNDWSMHDQSLISRHYNPGEVEGSHLQYHRLHIKIIGEHGIAFDLNHTKVIIVNC